MVNILTSCVESVGGCLLTFYSQDFCYALWC